MPAMPDSDSNAEDHDLLLAVRFLLNECSHDEAEQFEARLADDLVAQQALIDATSIVAMLQATSSCSESRPAPVVLPGSRFWRYSAMVAAVLLMTLAVTWQLLPRSTSNSIAIGEPVGLGDVWVGLEPDDFVPETLASIEDFDSSDEEGGSSHPLDDEPVSMDDEVPDWMLTAVLFEMEQSDPERIFVE